MISVLHRTSTPLMFIGHLNNFPFRFFRWLHRSNQWAFESLYACFSSVRPWQTSMEQQNDFVDDNWPSPWHWYARVNTRRCTRPNDQVFAVFIYEIKMHKWRWLACDKLIFSSLFSSPFQCRRVIQRLRIQWSAIRYDWRPTITISIVRISGENRSRTRPRPTHLLHPSRRPRRVLS